MSDHFAALEEIGRGTFCKVYRASPVSPAAQQMCRGKSVGVRAVALKVIDLHAYEGKPGARERVEAIIESEIKVLGRIANSDKLRNHPNIVRPMGVLREGDRVVVVMEQLRGGELFDRILAKGQHTEADAAAIVFKVASALKDLHNAGVVHRDVKPENLLYVSHDEFAELKLADFGMSMLEDAPDTVGALGYVGTIGYLSPEVVHSRSYSRACDVWALGCVAFVLIGGSYPFTADTRTGVFRKIVTRDFSFHKSFGWSRVSVAAKSLIERMLTLDPLRRATVEDVLRDPWVTRMVMTAGVSYAPSTSAEEAGRSDSIDMHGVGENNPVPINDLADYVVRRRTQAAALAVLEGAKFGIKLRLRELLWNSGLAHASLDVLRDLHMSFKTKAVLNSRTTWLAEGRVTVAQFEDVLRGAGYEGTTPVREVERLFDRTGAGHVSYVAFLTHVATLRPPTRETLEYCFDVHDTDEDGALHETEAANLLRNLLAGRVPARMDTDAMDLDITAGVELERSVEGFFTRMRGASWSAGLHHVAVTRRGFVSYVLDEDPLLRSVVQQELGVFAVDGWGLSGAAAAGGSAATTSTTHHPMSAQV